MSTITQITAVIFAGMFGAFIAQTAIRAVLLAKWLNVEQHQRARWGWQAIGPGTGSIRTIRRRIQRVERKQKNI